MRPIKPTDENSFNFDKQFRDNLRNGEITPPAGLWDKLDADLDQQQERVKYNHWYYASIALLLFFAGFNMISSFNVEEYYAANRLAQEHKYDGTYLLAGEHPSQVAGFSYSHYRRINNPINYAFEDNEPLVTVNNYANSRYFMPYIGVNASNIMYGTNKLQYNNTGVNRLAKAQTGIAALELQAPVNPLYIAINTKEQLIDKQVVTSIDFAPKKSNATYKKDDISAHNKIISTLGNIKGLYVGAEYVYSSTRLLQKNSAFYPLLGYDAKYSFQSGYQYGVKVGYHFNHKMAVELGWIINSTQGQSFSDNLYGKIPVNGSINLSYTQVPLMFKYKFARMSGITKQPVSLNIIGGFAYSRLKASKMNLNTDRLENIDEMVAQNEVGVIVGLEYDIYVHKNMFVTFGARTGLYTDTQLFKGYEKDAPRLHNFTMGISAAIHYQLPKRKGKSQLEY